MHARSVLARYLADDVPTGPASTRRAAQLLLSPLLPIMACGRSASPGRVAAGCHSRKG